MIKFDLIAGGPRFFQISQIVRQLLSQAKVLGITAIIASNFSIAAPSAMANTNQQDPCKKALETKSPLQFDNATGRASINVSPNPKSFKDKALNAIATQLGHSFFGLTQLQNAAVKMRTKDQDFSIPYFIRLTDALGFEIDLNRNILDRIPEKGAAVIVSNHPINGADLLSLAAVASIKRQDIKIVMTDALDGVPEMKNHAIFINTKENNGGRKLIQEMIAYLRKGGLLIIAPSGEVSRQQGPWVLDPEWKHGIISTLQLAGIKDIHIVPAFVEGQAGTGYQTARKLWDLAEHIKEKNKALVEQGQINEEEAKQKYTRAKNIAAYATGLFNMKEIAKHVDSRIELSVGPSVPYSVIENIQAEDPRNGKVTAAAYLRTRSLLQKNNNTVPEKDRALQTIIPPVTAELINKDFGKSEVEILVDTKPEEKDNGIQIYFAQGRHIPNIMREIGRLREITFRAEGEGSGLSVDLDQYDEYYHHLIAYDKKKKQIMGAYRAGLLKTVMEQKGLNAVYSTQFVHSSPNLIAKLPTVIELGRSFLIKEYQGHKLALPTLFAGIAQLFVRYPDYVDLMGVVSISDKYSKNSLQAMIQFLRKHHSHPEVLAVAKNPPDLKSPITQAEWDLLLKVHAPEKNSFKGLNQLIGIIEKNEKVKMPPLVGIYPENFGAKFLTFNYDPEFKATDGLILVHLPDLDPKTLSHFMKSSEHAQAYLKRHGRAP